MTEFIPLGVVIILGASVFAWTLFTAETPQALAKLRGAVRSHKPKRADYEKPDDKHIAARATCEV